MFLLTNSLSVSLITTFFPILVLILYAKFLWSRRRLYYYGSKVKGPIAFPIIGNLYRFISKDTPDFLNILIQLTNQYSGFYRFWVGPNLGFVVTIPEYIDKILTNPNALDKSADYRNFEPIVGKGVFSAPATMWKRQRKVFNSFLSRKNINDYMETNMKFTTQTVNNIKSELENAREIDVEHVIANNAMDATLEVVLGERSELWTNKLNFHAIESIMTGLYQRSYNIHHTYYSIFLLSKLGKSIDNLINSSHRMVNQIIQFRKKEIYQNEKSTSQSSLVDFLLTEFKEMEEDTQDILIRDEIMTLTVASADTSSTATNFFLLALGLFPKIQENVYKEVVGVFGKSDPIDWKQIHKLKYLDRVFKESLRLFPVAAFVGRKITEDIELGDGTILPEGSSAYIFILYLHRSKKYWPDPLKFDPDRFLPENVTNIPRCTYLPFSHGPRNCAGMFQAQLSIKTNIAYLVREFHVTTDYTNIEEVKLDTGLTVYPKNGYKTHLQLRDGLELEK